MFLSDFLQNYKKLPINAKQRRTNYPTTDADVGNGGVVHLSSKYLGRGVQASWTRSTSGI